MLLCTGAQMKEIDRRAIEEFHIPGITLMERAAKGILLELARRFPARKRTYFILCGKGNNGGDGYMLGTLLREQGERVVLCGLAAPEELTGDAKDACGCFLSGGGEILPYSEFVARALHTPREGMVLIDALLGTGLRGEVRPAYLEAIRLINHLGAFTVAMDVPSGADSDTGQVCPQAVRADLTVTFELMKIAHETYPAKRCCGTVRVHPIGIPEQAIKEQRIQTFGFGQEELRRILPRLEPEAHKGSCGRVLIGGGSGTMAGAPVLNARAALRAGAGLVTLCVPEGRVTSASVRVTEALCGPLEIEDFLRRAETADAVVFGSGAGQSHRTGELLHALLTRYHGPLVLDADGINILSGHIEWLKKRSCDLILTPHPGEMKRLLGDGFDDRVETARRFAIKHRCVVALKGARTVTAGPDGRVFVNLSGNPGMATAGSGDALAGIIGAFCARGLKPLPAAAAGVFVHGRAGDLAAKQGSQYGTTAGDIVEQIPYVLRGFDGLE